MKKIEFSLELVTELVELANKAIGYTLPQGDNLQDISFTKWEDESILPVGRHELGFGSWLNETRYSFTNERCDVALAILKDHPFIKAVKFSHYHRQGWVGALTFYIHTIN